MPFRQLRRGQLDTLHVLSTRKISSTSSFFYPLYAIISILRLLFRNISRVIIFTTKREQENENERKNFGVYRCTNFYFITRETFDECTCTEDMTLQLLNTLIIISLAFSAYFNYLI